MLQLCGGFTTYSIFRQWQSVHVEKEVCCLLPLPSASGPHHAHQLVALATHLPTSALYKRQVPTLSLPDCALPHESFQHLFPLCLSDTNPSYFSTAFEAVPACFLSPTINCWICLPVQPCQFCLTRLPVNLPASTSDCETTKPCQPSVLWIKLFNSTWLCCTWFLVSILIMGFSATECYYWGLRWWGIGKLWEPDWWSWQICITCPSSQIP